MKASQECKEFGAHVQNPVYSDNQANSGYDKAPLKHAFAPASPKVCFSPAIYPRLKHVLGLLQLKVCFNASPA